jgi:DNA-directed RNA polymerase subunit RPC12/RpoP
MAIIMKMAAFWSCECCKTEWFMKSEKAPRQCPKCGSRRWNEGEAAEVERYLRSLVVRHINPYRKPLSFRQKAAVLRLKAERSAARATKEVAAPAKITSVYVRQ